MQGSIEVAGLPQGPSAVGALETAPEAVAGLAPQPSVSAGEPALGDAPGADPEVQSVASADGVSTAAAPTRPGAPTGPADAPEQVAALTPLPATPQSEVVQSTAPSLDAGSVVPRDVTDVAVARAPGSPSVPTTPGLAPEAVAALTPSPAAIVTDLERAGFAVAEDAAPSVTGDAVVAAIATLGQAETPSGPSALPAQVAALNPSPSTAPLSEIGQTTFAAVEDLSPALTGDAGVDVAAAPLAPAALSVPGAAPEALAALSPMPSTAPLSEIGQATFAAPNEASPAVSGVDGVEMADAPRAPGAPSVPGEAPGALAALSLSPSTAPLSEIGQAIVAAPDETTPAVADVKGVDVAAAPLAPGAPSAPGDAPEELAALSPSPSNAPLSEIGQATFAAPDETTPAVADVTGVDVAAAPLAPGAPSAPGAAPEELAALSPSPSTAPLSEVDQATFAAPDEASPAVTGVADVEVAAAPLAPGAPSAPGDAPEEIAALVPAPTEPQSSVEQGALSAASDDLSAMIGVGAVASAGLPLRPKSALEPAPQPEAVAAAEPAPNLPTPQTETAEALTPKESNDALSLAELAEFFAADAPDRPGVPSGPALAPAVSESSALALAIRSSLRPAPRPRASRFAVAAAEALVEQDAVTQALSTTETSVPTLEDLTSLRIFAPAGAAAQALSDAQAWAAFNGVQHIATAEVGFEIKQPQVRYYYAEDEAVAALLADGTNSTLRDFTDFSRLPPQGTIELWLPGTPEGQIVMAKAPPKKVSTPPRTASTPPKVTGTLAKTPTSVVTPVVTPPARQGFLARIFGVSASTVPDGPNSGDQASKGAGSQITAAASQGSVSGGSSGGSGGSSSGSGGSSGGSGGSGGSSGGPGTSSSGSSGGGSFSGDSRVRDVRNRVNNALGR